jgi:hypothetical protein
MKTTYRVLPAGPHDLIQGFSQGFDESGAFCHAGTEMGGVPDARASSREEGLPHGKEHEDTSGPDLGRLRLEA